MRWIDEINAFYNRAEINRVSTSVAALWHALMYLNSRHFWSNEFSAPNLVLQSLTGLSRTGIQKARNTLKQMGYIDFKPNGNKSTTYILHSLIANSVQDSVQVGVQVGVQDSVQVGVQAGGLYSTPIEILNNNKTKDKRQKTKETSTHKSNDLFVDEKKKRARYGEYRNVLLTDEQFEKLKSEFPADYEKRIEAVSAYCQSTGKSYKDYLATIRNWAKRDAEKQTVKAAIDSSKNDLDDLF